MATAQRLPKDPRSSPSTWEGKDKAGKIVRGEMRAGGEAVVNATLRRQGIVVRRSRSRPAARRQGHREGHRALHAPARDDDEGRRAAAAVVRHRRQGRLQPGGGASCSYEIKTEVETGSALAQAFRKYPLYFDALFCNLVRRRAGRYSRERCSTASRPTRKRSSRSSRRSRRRCSIPIAIIVVAFIITAVIMIFVIPAFKQVFTNFGADLPAPTLFVMAHLGLVRRVLVHHLSARSAAPSTASSRPGSARCAVQIFMDRLMLQDAGVRRSGAASRPSRAGRARCRRCSRPACRWSRRSIPWAARRATTCTRRRPSRSRPRSRPAPR